MTDKKSTHDNLEFEEWYAQHEQNHLPSSYESYFLKCWNAARESISNDTNKKEISPDIKFEGLDYNSETLEIKYKGKVIGKWNDEANQDYPEDLTWNRDIGSFALEMFEAGRASIVLPEWMMGYDKEDGFHKEEYVKGFNDCLDSIRAKNKLDNLEGG